MTNKLGVTATRKGLTPYQRSVIKTLCKMYDEVHHGDCVGGDDEIDDIAADAGCKIVIHPPTDPKLRAFCHKKKDGADRTVLPEKPYLQRNRQIVRETDRTSGFPYEDVEPAPARGQGTWSTIRFARGQDKLLEVVWP